MFYHEVRETVVRKGEPVLVKAGSDTTGYNFRSTFDYPTEVAEAIIAAGNTAGLKGVSVSCATIYIDVDDTDDVEEVRGILADTGVSFDEYRTGNRGAHFHVPLLTRVTGSNVLYSVTYWLKSIQIWHLIDISIYREGGQYRLEHAVHNKTGKYKMLVQEVDGELLDMELRDEPEEAIPTRTLATQTGSKRDFFMNLMLPRGVGQRHTHLWICWKSGIAAGFTDEEIRMALCGWNERQDTSHSDDMMMKKLADFARKESK